MSEHLCSAVNHEDPISAKQQSYFTVKLLKQ